jgi:hypothetical protein
MVRSYTKKPQSDQFNIPMKIQPNTATAPRGVNVP